VSTAVFGGYGPNAEWVVLLQVVPSSRTPFVCGPPCCLAGTVNVFVEGISVSSVDGGGWVGPRLGPYCASCWLGERPPPAVQRWSVLGAAPVGALIGRPLLS